MEGLTVPGTLDSLSPIGAYVITAAAAAGLDKKAAYRLRLAVDEIATNSIVHGYEEAGIAGEISVHADLSGQALTIFIEDTALEYDPRQAAMPDNLNAPIVERQLGGLGIYLTLQGVDGFLYERIENRNRSILTMNRPGATDAQAKTAAIALGRVLVVVGDDLKSKMFARQLESLGYATTIAEESLYVLDLARLDSFDLILLSLDLGKQDGNLVVEQLKADEKLKHIPILLISPAATHRVDRVSRCLEIGAEDFLIEPFSPLMLKARVQAGMEIKRLREEEEKFSRNEELLKLEHDVQIGRQIQLGFLPQTLPQPPGWEIAADFQPAREVAGDFYDVFTMTQGRRVGFVIADVCDKGVPAALFMALIRSLIRSAAQQYYPERGILESLTSEGPQPAANLPRQKRGGIAATALKESVLRTNNYVTDNHLELNMFATLFFGVFDPGTGALNYVNAGHNPPAIIGPNGIKARLTPTGPAVGMFPGATFEIGQNQLEPGDILYAFTDGCTDAKDPNGHLFSEKRLLALATQAAPTVTALLSGIDASLRTHIGTAAQFDDITMLGIRRASAPDTKGAA